MDSRGDTSDQAGAAEVAAEALEAGARVRRYRTRPGPAGPDPSASIPVSAQPSHLSRTLSSRGLILFYPAARAMEPAPAFLPSHPITTFHFMSPCWFPFRLHPAAALPAIGTPTVIDAWLRARNPNTVRGYHSDLERFREWLDAPSTAAAIEALLSTGQANANLMVMNYVAALVEQAWPAHDRPPACRLAIDGQDRPQDRPDELVPRRRGTESRGAPRHQRPGLARRPVALARRDWSRNRSPARRDRAILACLFDLGLRRAELCYLDRTDIEAGPDGGPAAIWIRGKGRTEKERMTLPDQTAAALVEWIEARGNEPGPFFHRLDGPKPAPDVRLSGESVRRIVRRLGKAAGLPRDVRPHGLRHARQHRLSMLDVISATSGALPAIDHWKWSYGMTTCGGMLPGRSPAIWP